MHEFEKHLPRNMPSDDQAAIDAAAASAPPVEVGKRICIVHARAHSLTTCLFSAIRKMSCSTLSVLYNNSREAGEAAVVARRHQCFQHRQEMILSLPMEHLRAHRLVRHNPITLLFPLCLSALLSSSDIPISDEAVDQDERLLPGTILSPCTPSRGGSSSVGATAAAGSGAQGVSIDSIS